MELVTTLRIFEGPSVKKKRSAQIFLFLSSFFERESPQRLKVIKSTRSDLDNLETFFLQCVKCVRKDQRWSFKNAIPRFANGESDKSTETR